MKIQKICVIILILFIISTGCHYSEGLKSADKAVAKFHEQFNKKEFEEIYDKSSIEFKGVFNKEKVIKDLENIRENLGKVESTVRRGWAVEKNSIRLETTANFETKFERGSGKERFVFSIIDDKVELMNYEFDSEDFKLE